MSRFSRLEDWYEPIPKKHTGIRSWFEMQRYRVISTLHWELIRPGSDIWISVPVGYEFDVSIPKYMWWLMSPSNPRFHKAACMHDYLLEVKQLDRVAACVAFSEALRASGVWKPKRLIMVLSVIIFHFR